MLSAKAFSKVVMPILRQDNTATFMLTTDRHRSLSEMHWSKEREPLSGTAKWASVDDFVERKAGKTFQSIQLMHSIEQERRKKKFTKTERKRRQKASGSCKTLTAESWIDINGLSDSSFSRAKTCPLCFPSESDEAVDDATREEHDSLHVAKPLRVWPGNEIEEAIESVRSGKNVESILESAKKLAKKLDELPGRRARADSPDFFGPFVDTLWYRLEKDIPKSRAEQYRVVFEKAKHNPLTSNLCSEICPSSPDADELEGASEYPELLDVRYDESVLAAMMRPSKSKALSSLGECFERGLPLVDDQSYIDLSKQQLAVSLYRNPVVPVPRVLSNPETDVVLAPDTFRSWLESFDAELAPTPGFLSGRELLRCYTKSMDDNGIVRFAPKPHVSSKGVPSHAESEECRLAVVRYIPPVDPEHHISTDSVSSSSNTSAKSDIDFLLAVVNTEREEEYQVGMKKLTEFFDKNQSHSFISSPPQVDKTHSFTHSRRQMLLDTHGDLFDEFQEEKRKLSLEEILETARHELMSDPLIDDADGWEKIEHIDADLDEDQCTMEDLD